MNRETPELDRRWLIYMSRLPPWHPVRVELRCKGTIYNTLNERNLAQISESMWLYVARCGMMWHYVAVWVKSMFQPCVGFVC